jgi:hypothetical protein
MQLIHDYHKYLAFKRYKDKVSEIQFSNKIQYYEYILKKG